MTRFILRALTLAGLLGVPFEVGAQGPDTPVKELRIGVREDAASMSYRISTSKPSGAGGAEGPLREAGFAGYMVYLCDRVLVDMERIYGDGKLRVHAEPVVAAEMWEKLDTGELDIICGPTTATLDRLRNRIASPPVFISGASYATRAPQEINACRPLVGYLKSSTTGSGALKSILRAGVWPQNETNALNAAITGGSNWQSLYEKCDAAVLPRAEFTTHDELADAFCAGDLKYYVGDFEIMARSLQAASQRREGGCNYTLSDRTFSEERYVILGNIREQSADDADAHVAHFFEILSRRLFFKPSIVDAAFEDAFALSEPSRKLEWLFWALRGNR